MKKAKLRKRQKLAVKVEVRKWQTRHIQEGIRQADAGEFASEAQVAAAFACRRK
jgi:predicted transcriptional regulator